MHSDEIVCRDLNSLKIVFSIAQRTIPIRSLAISPDEKTLAWASLDGKVRLWDLTAKKPDGILAAHDDEASDVVFSPDGKLLISGGADKCLVVWDVQTRKLVATLVGHKEGVNAVAVSPDGRLLASGSWDGVIKIWDLSSKKQLVTLVGRDGPVPCLAFSPTGGLLASGDGELIRLWSVSTGKELGILHHHSDRARTTSVVAIAFTTDGKLFASADGAFTVRLWSTSHLLLGK
jgi:WD40 repeat protein